MALDIQAPPELEKPIEYYIRGYHDAAFQYPQRVQDPYYHRGFVKQKSLEKKVRPPNYHEQASINLVISTLREEVEYLPLADQCELPKEDQFLFVRRQEDAIPIGDSHIGASTDRLCNVAYLYHNQNRRMSPQDMLNMLHEGIEMMAYNRLRVKMSNIKLKERRRSFFSRERATQKQPLESKINIFFDKRGFELSPTGNDDHIHFHGFTEAIIQEWAIDILKKKRDRFGFANISEEKMMQQIDRSDGYKGYRSVYNLIVSLIAAKNSESEELIRKRFRTALVTGSIITLLKEMEKTSGKGSIRIIAAMGLGTCSTEYLDALVKNAISSSSGLGKGLRRITPGYRIGYKALKILTDGPFYSQNYVIGQIKKFLLSDDPLEKLVISHTILRHREREAYNQRNRVSEYNT